MDEPDAIEDARAEGQLAPALAQPGPADADAELRAIVAAKIAENHAGAPVSYSLTATPQLSAQGQVAAGYMMILSMRSPLLSPPRIAAVQLIDDAYPTPEHIDKAVRDCLAVLYQARADLLRPGPPGGYHPGAN